MNKENPLKLLADLVELDDGDEQSVADLQRREAADTAEEERLIATGAVDDIEAIDAAAKLSARRRMYAPKIKQIRAKQEARRAAMSDPAIAVHRRIREGMGEIIAELKEEIRAGLMVWVDDERAHLLAEDLVNKSVYAADLWEVQQGLTNSVQLNFDDCRQTLLLHERWMQLQRRWKNRTTVTTFEAQEALASRA